MEIKEVEVMELVRQQRASSAGDALEDNPQNGIANYHGGFKRFFKDF